jgi:PAS domain S-box-containing protein
MDVLPINADGPRLAASKAREPGRVAASPAADGPDEKASAEASVEAPTVKSSEAGPPGAVLVTDEGEPDHFVQLALLAAIVASSDDAIVSKSLEGQIRTWNAGAERIFGYTAAEVIGKSITIIIPDELQAEEREILAKVRRGERIEHFDTTRVTKDGRRISISLTVSPVRNARGEIVGASKIARDVSERKRVEDALLEADRRKDEFLALLAHELRNPLAPIRYALEMAKKPGRTEQQQALAKEVIERQVAHMSHLLDDLLDVSRITRGTLELRKQPIDLESALTAAIETAQPILDAKGHELIRHLPQQRVRLCADAVRLAQVFSNLLINAAKYTPTGGRIELSAECEPRRVCVRVRDNGVGIAPEVMPHLFKMFSQAPSTHAHADSGLGVGLSLVRGLVELHGGAVEARSKGLGCGSEFVVRLPLGGEVHQPQGRAQKASGNGKAAALSILIIDDNCDAADSCKALLELSGHRVQTAYTGVRGFERAEALRPDVILLDIGLPDVDGYQLARKIRATRWGTDTTLVAITGWGQVDDRHRAFAAGFNHHLTKPVAPATLEALLATLAERKRSAEL